MKQMQTFGMEEYSECVRAHEEAVISNDEYKLKKLVEVDKNIKYIVDIGANTGSFSAFCQELFPKAKIIAAEPHPDLMKIAKLNTDNKIIYAEKAIIDDAKKKKVTFNICKWGGNGHVDGHFRWDLFEPMGSKLDRQIKVEAVTLKKLMEDNEFPRIDLLKIDCEGFEGGILQAFKPHMKQVKHFRGEWHGDAEIPLIKDALEKTHNVMFDMRYSTHGDVFATRKDFEEVTVLDKTFLEGDRRYRILANGKKQYMI